MKFRSAVKPRRILPNNFSHQVMLRDGSSDAAPCCPGQLLDRIRVLSKSPIPAIDPTKARYRTVTQIQVAGTGFMHSIRDIGGVLPLGSASFSP